MNLDDYSLSTIITTNKKEHLAVIISFQTMVALLIPLLKEVIWSKVIESLLHSCISVLIFSGQR